MKRLSARLLVAVGAAVLVGGIALLSVPAALIVGGIELLMCGLFLVEVEQ